MVKMSSLHFRSIIYFVHNYINRSVIYVSLYSRKIYKLHVKILSYSEIENIIGYFLITKDLPYRHTLNAERDCMRDNRNVWGNVNFEIVQPSLLLSMLKC